MENNKDNNNSSNSLVFADKNMQQTSWQVENLNVDELTVVELTLDDLTWYRSQRWVSASEMQHPDQTEHKIQLKLASSLPVRCTAHRAMTNLVK